MNKGKTNKIGNIYDFQKEVDSAVKDFRLDVLQLIEAKMATFSCPFYTHAGNDECSPS